MALTMVDGKVINALTGNRSTCDICKRKPKSVRDINMLNQDIIENYSLGLSTLHAWIRTFEFCSIYPMDMDIYPTSSAEESTHCRSEGVRDLEKKTDSE